MMSSSPTEFDRKFVSLCEQSNLTAAKFNSSAKIASVATGAVLALMLVHAALFTPYILDSKQQEIANIQKAGDAVRAEENLKMYKNWETALRNMNILYGVAAGMSLLMVGAQYTVSHYLKGAEERVYGRGDNLSAGPR
jgi:hypothetical protein